MDSVPQQFYHPSYKMGLLMNSYCWGSSALLRTKLILWISKLLFSLLSAKFNQYLWSVSIKLHVSSLGLKGSRLRPYQWFSCNIYIHNFACLQNACKNTAVQFVRIFHQFSGLIFMYVCLSCSTISPCFSTNLRHLCLWNN